MCVHKLGPRNSQSLPNQFLSGPWFRRVRVARDAGRVEGVDSRPRPTFQELLASDTNNFVRHKHLI